MRIRKELLLMSTEQHPKQSSVFIGYIILKELSKKKRISIFELYQLIKQDTEVFNSKSLSSALIFLYINDLILFNKPFIELK